MGDQPHTIPKVPTNSCRLGAGRRKEQIKIKVRKRIPKPIGAMPRGGSSNAAYDMQKTAAPTAGTRNISSAGAGAPPDATRALRSLADAQRSESLRSEAPPPSVRSSNATTPPRRETGKQGLGSRAARGAGGKIPICLRRPYPRRGVAETAAGYHVGRGHPSTLRRRGNNLGEPCPWAAERAGHWGNRAPRAAQPMGMPISTSRSSQSGNRRAAQSRGTPRRKLGEGA